MPLKVTCMVVSILLYLCENGLSLSCKIQVYSTASIEEISTTVEKTCKLVSPINMFYVIRVRTTNAN